MDETYEVSEYEQIESEIRGCKLLLAESDYKTLKYAEGLIDEDEYTEIKEYRADLRAKINAYEVQLEALSE